MILVCMANFFCTLSTSHIFEKDVYFFSISEEHCHYSSIAICLVLLIHFRSDFAGATMCAECLLLLSQAPPWKLPISLTVNQYLQTSPQDMDLSSVFALLVIAGFPRVSPLLFKC